MRTNAVLWRDGSVEVGAVYCRKVQRRVRLFLPPMVEVANFRTSVTKNKKITKKEEYEHQARALGIKHVRQDLLTRSSF